MTIIDYTLLGQAQELYKHYGYEFVDVPWFVRPEASRATHPPEGGIFVLEDGYHLVGSAEQGFINDMMHLEPKKLYASVSPCFRKNDCIDMFHQETFMKLELFSYEPFEHKVVTPDQWKFENPHAANAMWVFHKMGIPMANLRNYLTSFSNMDIEVSTEHDSYIEIGSYGWRRLNGYRIHYGTGIALPRFQQAKALQRQFKKVKNYETQMDN